MREYHLVRLGAAAAVLLAVAATWAHAQESSAIKNTEQVGMQLELALEKKVSATVVTHRQPVDAGLARLRGCGAGAEYVTDTGCAP